MAGITGGAKNALADVPGGATEAEVIDEGAENTGFVAPTANEVEGAPNAARDTAVKPPEEAEKLNFGAKTSKGGLASPKGSAEDEVTGAEDETSGVVAPERKDVELTTFDSERLTGADEFFSAKDPIFALPTMLQFPLLLSSVGLRGGLCIPVLSSFFSLLLTSPNRKPDPNAGALLVGLTLDDPNVKPVFCVPAKPAVTVLPSFLAAATLAGARNDRVSGLVEGPFASLFGA